MRLSMSDSTSTLYHNTERLVKRNPRNLVFFLKAANRYGTILSMVKGGKYRIKVGAVLRLIPDKRHRRESMASGLCGPSFKCYRLGKFDCNKYVSGHCQATQQCF